jgi:hypothetical protein
MLKYKTIIFGFATIASAIFAFWTSNEQYFAYFVVCGLVFGAITCLLITLKMMASKTTVKIDPKNPPGMSDFGGGGGGEG